MIFIKKKSLLPCYISEIDKYLAEFDCTHSCSKRQKAEINKYQRIFRLRNYPIHSKKKRSIFDFEK